MKRFPWLGFVLWLYVICTGCGDTFRPIIIPNPPTFPNPAAAHTVVAISDNGTTVAGSVMVIDVSGDSISSVADCTTPLCIGVAPVHAVQQTASQVLVVNHSDLISQSDSISKVSFGNITNISSTTTIGLPPGSAPNFVSVAPNQTTAYVTLPNYVPDPINNPNVVIPSVGVVNTTSNNMFATIPLSTNPSSNPVAMAVTSDNSKLYVANQGDNTVSGFNTVGLSTRTIIGSFNAPLWVVARSDSQRVYILNGTTGSLQDGVVSTMDTTSTAGPDNVIDASVSVPGATSMLYDGNKNRLYIPGGSQLTMLDVSQSKPVVLTGGPIPTCQPPQSSSCIPTVLPAARGTADPCSLTGEQALTIAAVAALPDGTRAYVGSYYEDAVAAVNYICPQITVIDAVSNAVGSTIAVPGFPASDDFCSPTSTSRHARFRFMMAAAGDSSRAYLSSCDGGNVNIIDTSNGTYIENLTAPASSRLNNPPQNPVFLIAGP
jgi:hypothetical protein